MKIKSVKTRQFAGIKGKKVTFSDGLNVLVGKNETGKSTMIDLIYQVLYKDSKLNKKVDKDFYTRFMPSDSKGNVVDGTLVFSTADGEYTLMKKWGASEECELETPDGSVIVGEDKIREIIDGELIYKKGLYDDVVFFFFWSQESVVEHILNKIDKKAGAKQDLVSIIASEGLSSTGGIAPEDIEKILQDKIDNLSGRWDFAIDGPEKRRGIENPWDRGVGGILKAFYAHAELEDNLRKREQAEKAIDIENKKILEAKEKLEGYKAEKGDYERYAEALAAYKSGKELKNKYLAEQNSVVADLQAYPGLRKDYDEAQHLSELAKAKAVIEKFHKIQEAEGILADAKKEFEGKTEISVKDEKDLANLDKDIDNLRAKLSNLNLVANIRKLGNSDIQVKSVATGEIIDISAGEFDINETVEITVPGIMSMTIAAKGVDVEEVQRQLAEKKEERDALLSRCGAKNIDDLRTQKAAYEEASRKVDEAQKAYNNLVNGVDITILEDDYSRFKEKATETEGLDEKIENLCGSESLEAFIGGKKQRIQSLEEVYGKEKTLESMKAMLAEVKGNLEKLASVENDASNIPEKYLAIGDVDAYKKDLKTGIEIAEHTIKEAEGLIRDHEKELGNSTSDDLRAQIDDAAIELQKLKDDCRRWKHILEVLRYTRDNMAGEGTMSDVHEKFAEYLSVITDGRISLKSMDENMDVNIQSGNNHMTYEILSEGTKDTIALAFRLAILEHLFPDGGGLVVFDDPFTDMDESRTRQACKLVQRFADAGNQVIFVTCDNKYNSMLSGNIVEMN